ncbi:MAG: hypothetical protein AB4290_17895 [Spirulina sp.]
MNEQTSPNSSPQPEQINLDRANEASSENLQEQHVNLKLEVETIYRRVDRLRSLLQTLVSGLVVAILISLGVASWFSYRLLLQEKITRQETQKSLEAKEEILKNLNRLEEDIKNQELQLKQLREQIPQDLNTTIEENRKQLQQLREQIEQLQNATHEKQLDEKPSS